MKSQMWLAVLLAIFLFILPVLGDKGSGQVSLSIYVDEDFEKVLVVGFITDPESLPFPMASGQIYEKDTGTVYAVTDSLIKAKDDEYRLDFPLKGSFDECHAVIYIPGNIEMKTIDCSKGLDLFSSSYDGSLVLDIHGFDLTDPAINISYQAD